MKLNNRNRVATPFGDIQIDMENLVEQLFGDRTKGSQPTTAFRPAVEVTENESSYQVVVELAGVDPAAVEMELAGNTLTLSGKVAAAHETQTSGSGSESEISHNANFSAHERRTGDFKRAVELPTDAMTDDLSASAKHGLLTVSIPKQQSLKPRKITIAVTD